LFTKVLLTSKTLSCAFSSGAWGWSVGTEGYSLNGAIHRTASLGTLLDRVYVAEIRVLISGFTQHSWGLRLTLFNKQNT